MNDARTAAAATLDTYSAGQLYSEHGRLSLSLLDAEGVDSLQLYRDLATTRLGQIQGEMARRGLPLPAALRTHELDPQRIYRSPDGSRMKIESVLDTREVDVRDIDHGGVWRYYAFQLLDAAA